MRRIRLANRLNLPPRPLSDRRPRLAVEELEARNLLSTLWDFDGEGPPHAFWNPGQAQILDGGPTAAGQFLRLVRAMNDQHNSIAFARSDVGAFDLMVADFDMRLMPGAAEPAPPAGGRADGFGFALLNTAVPEYGTVGAVNPGGPFGRVAEEPNFTDSLGVGFDVYRNFGDIGNPGTYTNSISVHFNNIVLQQVDVSPVVDMANGQWLHVRVVVRAGAGISEVSVSITPRGAEEAVTVVNRLYIPSLIPYESRVFFAGRTGGENAHHDLDNVRVHFTDLTQSSLSLGSFVYTTLETDAVRRITVHRTGDVKTEVSVDYATFAVVPAPGSGFNPADAKADYTPVTGTLTFLAGETSQSFDVPLLNDDAQENDEIFGVRLTNPSVGAIVAGPATATVIVVDDELSAERGHWSMAKPWPFVAIHAALMPTGEVMFWDRPGSTALWNPTTEAVRPAAHPHFDGFCSGHSFLADGRLLVAGGHAHEGHPMEDGFGLADASIYDPTSDSWNRLPNMNAGRWYPTATTLANGDALVVSGTAAPGLVNTLPQVWDTANNRWRPLTGANSRPPLGADLYPWMFQNLDGRVFKAGADADGWHLNTVGAGGWLAGPARGDGIRTYGAAVMYEPGKILAAGGGDPPTRTARIIDFTGGDPAWVVTGDMGSVRRQHNGVVLPDGTVLITGGTSGAGFNDPRNPVLQPTLWNPVTGTWNNLLRPMTIPRLYHSTALLLPDGRVLSAGGGQPGPFSQSNFEVYSPSYLFRGPRPTILAAPDVLAYTSNFFVETPDAANIGKVSLVRLTSVTHSVNMDQRFLPLSFEQAENGLQVTAPPDGNHAPPGYYMLFVVTNDGVPSVARIVQVTAGAGPGGAPSGGGDDDRAAPTVSVTGPDPTWWSTQVDAGYRQSAGFAAPETIRLGQFDTDPDNDALFMDATAAPGSQPVSVPVARDLLFARAERDGFDWSTGSEDFVEGF